jgi:hypothetical protein
MKTLRSRNPVMFDLVLFLSFTLFAFLAYAMSEQFGMVGALTGIVLLAITSVTMVLSR